MDSLLSKIEFEPPMYQSGKHKAQENAAKDDVSQFVVKAEEASALKVSSDARFVISSSGFHTSLDEIRNHWTVRMNGSGSGLDQRTAHVFKNGAGIIKDHHPNPAANITVGVPPPVPVVEQAAQQA